MKSKGMPFVALIAACLLIVSVYWFWKSRIGPDIQSMGCPSCEVVLPSTTLPAITGTRRAVLIGLNYIGTRNELLGCIEDVRNVQEVLQGTLGYSPENITLLTEVSVTRPTRANIVAALTALISATRPGDVAFVWYSGHGKQISNPLAPMGFSNAWISLDGIILETELQDIFSLAPAGAKVFVGSDCCHSGTLLDLKYIFGELSLVHRVKAAVPPPGSFQSDWTATQGQLRKSFDALKSPSDTSAEGSHSHVLVSDSNFSITSADIVCLSGCRDEQTGSDTYVDSESQGAMTWSFLKTLRTYGKTVALAEMLANMRLLLEINSFDQVPQLSMGRAADAKLLTLDQFV